MPYQKVKDFVSWAFIVIHEQATRCAAATETADAVKARANLAKMKLSQGCVGDGPVMCKAFSFFF
jgi:hypothetical protein